MINNIMWVFDESCVKGAPPCVSDKRVIDAIKDFKGICCFHPNHFEIEKNYFEENNLYGIENSGKTKRYMGEYGTLRVDFPAEILKKASLLSELYIDESSPKRLWDTVKKIILDYFSRGEVCDLKFAYSSYRIHLFSIFTKKTDWNIRLPLLSPIFTLKQLYKIYGNSLFIWINLDSNQRWGFGKFSVPIPFNYHVKRMIKFAEKRGLEAMIYAGNQMTADEFLKKLNKFEKTCKKS